MYRASDNDVIAQSGHRRRCCRRATLPSVALARGEIRFVVGDGVARLANVARTPER